MVSLAPRLAPGTTFADRFVIVSHLGQGSMGAVYRAQLLDGSRDVALKLVSLAAATDGRAERRFEREVECGRRIASPYVVRVLDSGKLGASLAWIALELAEGVALDELVGSRGGLPLSEARPLLHQLFSAVAAAHREGIVHRDLTPQNIRVSREGGALSVKVLDFGIAKDVAPSTFSGTTPGLGTPLWTAPEQGQRGCEPTPSADVWALGLLTFFVLSGKLYWRHAAERASIADLALELLGSELEPASVRAACAGGRALPRGFDAWFAGAVHRDPNVRFREAEAAWRELEPLLDAERRPEELAPERPTVTMKPFGFVTVVILSCVAAGLAIYWLVRSMHI